MPLAILVIPDALLQQEPANMPAESRRRARIVQRRELQLQRLLDDSPALRACFEASFAALGAFLVDDAKIDFTALSSELGVKADLSWLAHIAGEALPPQIKRDDSLRPDWQYEGTPWARPSLLKSLFGVFGLGGRPAFDGTGSRVGVIEFSLAEHAHVTGRLDSQSQVSASSLSVGTRVKGLDVHGTHVGGLVVGPKGIAPDARLAFATIADDTERPNFLALIRALNWLASNEHVKGEDFGCDVINVSIDFSTFEKNAAPMFTRLLEDHGTLLVVGNGNESRNKLCKYGAVLAVGAHNGSGPVSAYASGAAIFAPGTAIASCSPNGDFESLSGTSFAAPQVAAAAAVLLEKTPGLRGDGAKFKSAVLALTTPETYGLKLDISKL